MISGLEFLDVAIGLAFVFLSVSLICTAVREGLEGFLKMRAMDLERGVRELLSDPEGNTITKTLFEHPMIYSLFSGSYDPAKLKVSSSPTAAGGTRVMPISARRHLPSYIPAGNFASALLDIVARGPVTTGATAPAATMGEMSIESLRAGITANLPDGKLQRAVLTLIDQAQGDLDLAKKNVETWFNGTMDRVSGWYKRRTQLMLFLIGLFVAVALNIDAVHVAERLSNDKTLRQSLVAQAEKVDAQILTNEKDFNKLRGQLSDLGLPIGYPPPQFALCELGGDVKKEQGGNATGGQSGNVKTEQSGDAKKEPGVQVKNCEGKPFYYSVAKVVIGWFITAFAVMLGAPFWFDALNKMMVIRSTVKPHEKSPEEGSEDHPDSGSPAPTVTAASGAGRAAASATSAPEPAAFDAHEWEPSTGNTPNQGVI